MDKLCYQFRLGDFKCMAVTDGLFTRDDARFLFKNPPDDLLKQALQAYGIQPDCIPASATCLLVDTGQHRVLIDTGFGAGVSPEVGGLLQNLAAEGVYPTDIDTVILSHGHPDHIGGSTDSQNLPTFPKADYVMWQVEWDYWTSPKNLANEREVAAQFARKHLPPLSSQITPVDRAGVEIRPGIFTVPAPGHSPGHMAIEIRSQGERLYFLADTALHPLHFEHPDWFAMVDANPEQVSTTRRNLFEQIAAEQALILGYHFEFPGLGYIVPSGPSWRWIASDAAAQSGNC